MNIESKISKPTINSDFTTKMHKRSFYGNVLNIQENIVQVFTNGRKSFV